MSSQYGGERGGGGGACEHLRDGERRALHLEPTEERELDVRRVACDLLLEDLERERVVQLRERFFVLHHRDLREGRGVSD